MPMNYEKIFLGSCPVEQRRYLRYAMDNIKGKFDRFFLPATGQSSLAQVLIDAGIKPEQIFTSDISIFTSLIHFYITDQPIDQIPLDFKIAGAREFCLDHEDELDKVAHILYLLKDSQIKGSNFYEAIIKRDMYARKDVHIKSIKKHLLTLKTRLQGINYEIKDMRAVLLNPELTERDLIVVNPPAFGKGYEKMFANDMVAMKEKVEEFDIKKEYLDIYFKVKASPATMIIYRQPAPIGLPNEDIYFCKQYNIKRQEYWLITKPQPELKKLIKYLPKKFCKALRGVSIFTDEDELTENTKVSFIKMKEENSLYYRDLFAHRLGDTKAEMYVGILLDGKFFATLGFNSSELRRNTRNEVYELFGFNAPSDRYQRINRLMMMFITCKEFKPIMTNAMGQANRVYELNGLATTCLSKYRKVKLNNGILNVTGLEKMPNELYKIKYTTNWHDRTFKDCIKIYLEELKTLEEKQSNKNKVEE